MSSVREPIWELDEHTLAKHEILRNYLGAWFPILAKGSGRIVYIDGFAFLGYYALLKQIDFQGRIFNLSNTCKAIFFYSSMSGF